MIFEQKEIQLPSFERGFHLITDYIVDSFLEIKSIEKGFLKVFVKHTSASLTINENADPTVREDFETHFNHNSIVHLSKTEKNLRQLIISGIYDNDVDFLKKHFKTLWEQIIDTKLRSEKNIRKPKEDTELDYATFGQLLDILKNKSLKVLKFLPDG